MAGRVAAYFNAFLLQTDQFLPGEVVSPANRIRTDEQGDWEAVAFQQRPAITKEGMVGIIDRDDCTTHRQADPSLQSGHDLAKFEDSEFLPLQQFQLGLEIHDGDVGRGVAGIVEAVVDENVGLVSPGGSCGQQEQKQQPERAAAPQKATACRRFAAA